MSSSNGAISALILVPIVIAASAAFIALKTQRGFQSIFEYFLRIWEDNSPWSHRGKNTHRRKQKRSDLSSTQIYADSWCDLESIHSGRSAQAYSTFIGQTGSKANMASQPFESSTLELHQLDISRPKPLRIVKRSQTISGSPAPRKALRRGRRASSSSDQRDGSPPWGADRSLTVRKKRQGRGSVLGIKFDGSSIPNPASDMFSLGTNNHEPVQGEHDSEITPKAARAISTTTSDWGVLEPAPYPKDYNINPNKYPAQSARGSNSSDSGFVSASSISGQKMPYANIPQRRFSRSKSFLLKAIGGRSGPPKHKSSRSADSGSINILLRRLSRGRYRDRSPWNSSTSGSASCIPGDDSLELDSRDIADIRVNSRISSGRQLATAPPSSNNAHRLRYRESLVLSPRVVVTPEVSSVDLDKCSFWLAIEIRGVVRHADGRLKPDDGLSESSTTFINAQSSGPGQYGYLHSMRIDLLPAHNCFITELIGDLDDSSIFQANQTRLILARISLGECDFFPNLTSPFSEELLSDLEKHLGDTLTTYLTIRLTYKHSGFPDNESPVSFCGGGALHTTQLQTDATAVIRRHDLESVWSPQILQSINGRPVSNPLTAIVEKCLPTDQARQIIRRLAYEQRPFQLHQRMGGISSFSKGSGYQVAKSAATTADSAVYSPLVIGPALPMDSDVQSQMVEQLEDPFIQFPPPPKIRGHSVDPARKIWREMRQTSRGRCYNEGWSGFTCDHYSAEEDLTPTRKSSSDATSSTLDTTGSGKAMSAIRQKMDDVDDDRGRILEMALRNKRSVGTDTLRSIAPSVRRGTTGTVSGLGLGLGIGRTWGWGPSWW
ncbi:uncharacterized protein BP5553_06434 [Venustampulla echinocandica]|uniref:Uncharacterized protein n=1 Tax=Venustampulla echinocandica TaxID=2656787 RepID=A0A370TJW8_9HELO|nr:uncharacterized protein BP5553_06434 [Venustampulla echinocandica]RDL35822.1 hypothetical protein BP5553_06434 [Venustampulla echinocandica]